MPKITSGAHSPASFASLFLTPLFADGTITEYPGANHYSICYGELCAYRDDELLAIWSVEVPDVQEDVKPGASYAGEWEAEDD